MPSRRNNRFQDLLPVFKNRNSDLTGARSVRERIVGYRNVVRPEYAGPCKTM